MKPLALVLLFFICAFSVNAQKVKYKDLYVLLRAKNYKDGAGFLKKYLRDNPEHPNANYQMALMIEFKIAELDLLKQSDAIIQRADSALLYFDKAYNLINERDVKKHDDDYYELFKRRNLRTGKFEVILSDVQLDIENRKNILNTKKKDVKTINSAFNRSVSLYDSAVISYKILSETYIDSLSLSFGANDSTVLSIKEIIINYDSSLYNFKLYKRLKKQFESSLGETIITISPLVGFDEKGLIKPSFYSAKVEFKDFSSWGSTQLAQIDEQHELINSIIELDASLDLLGNQISQDSVDLSSKIFKKITDPSLKSLKVIDATSVVFNLLNYKIGVLNINSALMTWYINYADTMDVGLQISFANNLETELETIELLIEAIGTTGEDAFWTRYHSFITARYTSLDGFNSFLDAQPAIIKGLEETITQISKLVLERDKWAYSASDSIPLSIAIDSFRTFQTFYVDSLDNRILKIAGLTNKDGKNNFYFSTVPSSRRLDSLYFAECSLTIEDVGAQSFFMHSVPAVIGSEVILIGNINKNTFTLIHYSESSGVLWKKIIELEDPSDPKLFYKGGQVIISVGESERKFALEGGDEVLE